MDSHIVAVVVIATRRRWRSPIVTLEWGRWRRRWQRWREGDNRTDPGRTTNLMGFMNLVNLTHAMPPINRRFGRYSHHRNNGYHRNLDDRIAVASPEIRRMVAIAIEAATAICLCRRRKQSQ
jgi:hypothetical protein